jgi:hypothetical protein
MRLLGILLLLALAGGSAWAGEMQSLYAAGVSYNPSASPRVAGTALYARSLSADKTYAFTVFDALPVRSSPPYAVTTQVGLGVAQRLFSIQKLPIYIPTAAGVSWTGQNTGWSWTTGGMTVISVRGGWRVLPHLRILKSSVGDGGYVSIVGVMVGWGQ